MKKILTIVLAGLLLIGLAGCSGALHNSGSVTIVGYKLINASAYNGETLYVHGQTATTNIAQPGNVWGNTTPHQCLIADGTGTITFSDANKWTVAEDVNIQVIKTHWDEKVIGGANAIFAANTVSVGEEYYITCDCATGTVSFTK